MTEDYNVITLEQFVNKYDSSSEKDIPELKKMFLSMDKKMKMYHDNNYVISSFRLQDILVYSIIDDNGEYQYDVDFKNYTSDVENISEIMQKNIFYSACLAVGVYNNCLSYINPEKPTFLKNNFSLFAENMPSDVVPYYRGVIERDAPVYLSVFVTEKEKREIDKIKMENETMAAEEAKKREQVHTTNITQRENSIWGTSQSAFSSIALFPLLIAAMGIIIPIIIGLLS